MNKIQIIEQDPQMLEDAIKEAIRHFQFDPSFTPLINAIDQTIRNYGDDAKIMQGAKMALARLEYYDPLGVGAISIEAAILCAVKRCRLILEYGPGVRVGNYLKSKNNG